MVAKTKTREITIVDEGGAFSAIFRNFRSGEDYDFKGLALLRKLLTNEKARLLHFVKTKSPKSIYELAKFLERDFKSVNDDVKLLEKFGFLDFVREKSGKRERLRPVLAVEGIYIHIKI